MYLLGANDESEKVDCPEDGNQAAAFVGVNSSHSLGKQRKARWRSYRAVRRRWERSAARGWALLLTSSNQSIQRNPELQTEVSSGAHEVELGGSAGAGVDSTGTRQPGVEEVAKATDAAKRAAACKNDRIGAGLVEDIVSVEDSEATNDAITHAGTVSDKRVVSRDTGACAGVSALPPLPRLSSKNRQQRLQFARRSILVSRSWRQWEPPNIAPVASVDSLTQQQMPRRPQRTFMMRLPAPPPGSGLLRFLPGSKRAAYRRAGHRLFQVFRRMQHTAPAEEPILPSKVSDLAGDLGPDPEHMRASMGDFGVQQTSTETNESTRASATPASQTKRNTWNRTQGSHAPTLRGLSLLPALFRDSRDGTCSSERPVVQRAFHDPLRVTRLRARRLRRPLLLALRASLLSVQIIFRSMIMNFPGMARWLRARQAAHVNAMIRKHAAIAFPMLEEVECTQLEDDGSSIHSDNESGACTPAEQICIDEDGVAEFLCADGHVDACLGNIAGMAKNNNPDTSLASRVPWHSDLGDPAPRLTGPGKAQVSKHTRSESFTQVLDAASVGSTGSANAAAAASCTHHPPARATSSRGTSQARSRRLLETDSHSADDDDENDENVKLFHARPSASLPHEEDDKDSRDRSSCRVSTLERPQPKRGSRPNKRPTAGAFKRTFNAGSSLSETSNDHFRVLEIGGVWTEVLVIHSNAAQATRASPQAERLPSLGCKSLSVSSMGSSIDLDDWKTPSGNDMILDDGTVSPGNNRISVNNGEPAAALHRGCSVSLGTGVHLDSTSSDAPTMNGMRRIRSSSSSSSSSSTLPYTRTFIRSQQHGAVAVSRSQPSAQQAPSDSQRHLDTSRNPVQPGRRRRCQVVFLPGNPGCIELYESFLLQCAAMLAQAGHPSVEFVIHGVGLAGHDLRGLNRPGRFFDLSEQTRHKLAYIREHVGWSFAEDSNYINDDIDIDDNEDLVLIGHSTGAHIICRMLEASPALAERAHVILLTPAIAEVADGIRTAFRQRAFIFQRGARHITAGLASMILRVAPERMVSDLIDEFLAHRATPQVARRIRDLFRLAADKYHLFLNVLALAADKCLHIGDMNIALLRRFARRLVMYYVPDDPFATSDQCARVRRQVPEAHVEYESGQIYHGFILSEQQTEYVARKVVHWVLEAVRRPPSTSGAGG